MASSVYPDSVEPAHYPNTKIFVNLLGITNSKELSQKEAGFTAIRSIELLQKINPEPQSFDFESLKFIHYYLFQDLYSWAGKPRSYDMGKNGDSFTPAKDLLRFENQVFDRAITFSHLKKRPSLEEASMELASCLGIINIYHPFPEGNGRAQRIFISLLADVFQYSINWNLCHAWEIVETSKQVHINNYEPLERLMNRIIIDKSMS